VKIHTITIDFWGTLLFDGPSSDNRYKRRRMADFEKILVSEGVRVTAAALDRAYEASGEFLSRIWATHRDVPAEAHVKAILDAIDPEIAPGLGGDAKAALLDAYSRPALMVPPAVDDGALYTALHRLAARGLVEAEWGLSENNRKAKYYALTAAGRRELRQRAASWDRYAAAVARVLGTA